MQQGFRPNSTMGTPVDGPPQLSQFGKKYKGSFADVAFQKSLEGVEAFDEKEAGYARFRPVSVGMNIPNPPTGGIRTPTHAGMSILVAANPQESLFRANNPAFFLAPSETMPTEVGPPLTGEHPDGQLVYREADKTNRPHLGGASIARVEAEGRKGKRRKERAREAGVVTADAPDDDWKSLPQELGGVAADAAQAATPRHPSAPVPATSSGEEYPAPAASYARVVEQYVQNPRHSMLADVSADEPMEKHSRRRLGATPEDGGTIPPSHGQCTPVKQFARGLRHWAHGHMDKAERTAFLAEHWVFFAIGVLTLILVITAFIILISGAVGSMTRRRESAGVTRRVSAPEPSAFGGRGVQPFGVSHPASVPSFGFGGISGSGTFTSLRPAASRVFGDF